MRALALGSVDLACHAAFRRGLVIRTGRSGRVFPPEFEPWELLGVFLGYAITRTEAHSRVDLLALGFDADPTGQVRPCPTGD